MKVLPISKEYLEFKRKFGGIGYCGDSSTLSYMTRKEGKAYDIPTDATQEKLEELFKKSLKDNKDYVLEYVKG